VRPVATRRLPGNLERKWIFGKLAIKAERDLRRKKQTCFVNENKN
jgi:hypothetical protein